MKKVSLLIFLSVLLISCGGKEVLSTSFSPVDYVNPLVGTQSKFTLSTGNTYPAVALPWGMNFWTPQTGDMGNGWAYCYTDDKIKGFKQTHQPSPWINDYGQFALMPVTGGKKFLQNERGSWFSHKAETARPYYYSVYLADHDVKTEITPTERSAYFRFTFPESEESYIVVDAFDNGSFVQIDEENGTVTGYTTKNSGGVPDNFRNYFVMKFDKPFASAEVWSGDKIIKGKREVEDNHVGAVLGFKTYKGEKIGVKVSSSFISEEQAWLNLEELGSRNFNEVKESARNAWNDVMNRVRVEGGTDEQLRTFYSCLYRSLLFPRKFYEVDKYGNIVHYSPYNGEVRRGYMHTDTGFWDTFRALFPFLNLMYPSVNKEIQEGLANSYEESGFLPEWASPGHRHCMVGNNSASVVADAYLKGCQTEKIDLLYEAVLHGANHVHPQVPSTGRLGYEYYNQKGYVPYNVGINENVARTLEYAYDDFVLAQVAKKLGKTDDYKALIKRAENYRNVIDPETGYARGRHADGTWIEPFDPFASTSFICEGTPYHYTWYAPQDIAGLIRHMGGKERFINRLDNFFEGNYYWHGNEPGHHIAYLFAYAGEPWKTQKWVHDIINREYFTTPDGLSGNDDAGQMSSWLVFSMVGFYPVCPGMPYYVIGSPSFEESVITLENGKKFTIEAPGASDKNIYIQSATLNGQPYDKSYILHTDIMNGGKLSFVMGDSPNKEWASSAGSLPPSMGL